MIRNKMNKLKMKLKKEQKMNNPYGKQKNKNSK